MAFIPQPFVWTHEQENDLIELGERPAQMLKGENQGPGETRTRLIAGRAHRGLEPLLVQRRRRASRLRREALELDQIKQLLRIS